MDNALVGIHTSRQIQEHKRATTECFLQWLFQIDREGVLLYLDYSELELHCTLAKDTVLLVHIKSSNACFFIGSPAPVVLPWGHGNGKHSNHLHRAQLRTQANKAAPPYL